MLGVWLVAQVDEHTVWLGQLWLRLVDSARNSVESYVPLPLVVDNPLGRHVVMRRVAEQVPVSLWSRLTCCSLSESVG